MNLKEEFEVWINPYTGSAGYVVKSCNNEADALAFAKKHTGIKRHGGRVERCFTTRSVVSVFEPEAPKTHFPHVNKRL